MSKDEAAALRQRIQYAKELKRDLENKEGLVYQTVVAYTDIIDGERLYIGRTLPLAPP